MKKEIVVDVSAEQTRVALLEEGVLVELYLEEGPGDRLVGNIYRGRVKNVLPGMQAAFVDIGLARNAFLHVEDLVPPGTPFLPRISDLLKPGQEIVVQVVKEPMGTKGAKVTTRITLPGRYLVLMPTVNYVAISRRIGEEEKRERLRELAARCRPPGMGVIVRTAAKDAAAEELAREMKLLCGLWEKIRRRAREQPVPGLLHRDLELVQRTLRDVFTEEVHRLVVNSRAAYEAIMDWLELAAPALKYRVFLREGEDLFWLYGIESEIRRALARKVWLACGGYLVFDQTEALTVIDVNTGKYVGGASLEETVLRTNVEAAREIARQLRLRNIGGIIIIDFIDMSREDHRRQVLEVLEEGLQRDRTRTQVLGITQLGLVEMTRKKTRPSLAELLLRPCPCCEGQGRVQA
ncbi:Rne/Rng family ribonuclease [Desulfovirgula thermocuniculi]|uniref:Rne/Rng family ribonuclease n=1 Tax=Desulfovirgula thermocuniculi TaxID=348842 RepID=UPI00041ADE3F|nr:Rne/Rng family ribonuclease [Desulfovirgula thermocuniculi]